MHAIRFGCLFLCNLLLLAESATYINGRCVDCQNGVLVPTAGASIAAPLMRQLSFSFRLVEDTVEVDYVSQNVDTAMTRLQSACRKTYELDFAALDYSLEAYQANTALLSTDLQALPVVGSAAVATYNFPFLTPNVDPDLRLSRRNLYDLYTGNISVWNDPRLIATNPLLATRLPNQTIIVVIRSDPHGSCGAVMSIFDEYDPSIGTKAYTKYPQNLLSLTNHVVVQGNTGVIAAVTSIPYSIGIAAQSYVDEAGLPDAFLENRAGQYVEAADDIGVYNAISSAVNDSGFDHLNVADAAGNDTYPLSVLIYVVYHTDVNTQCDSRIAMAQFIHWMLTNDNSLEQIYGYPGFIPLPTVLADHVLGVLGSLTCDGTSLLEVTFQDYGGTVLTQTLTVFSSVLTVVAVCILSTLSYKRNNRITRAAGLAFAFFFLLGCIFNYISVIFWASAPLNTSICIARYSFVTLGYALILGAMFAKCWEISKIFYRAEKGDISPFKELPWWMFCRAFFFVVFFEALFLLIWLTVDPPLSTVRIIDDVTITAIHECTTHYPVVWYCLHFIYFGVVLVWGAYLAYMTRDIWQKYNYPNESRSILLSIYNLAFCAVILVPLVTALDASAVVLCFLISVAIIFPTTFALVVVHGPKMLAFLATSISKGSHRSGSKGSTGPGHPAKEGAASREREVSHTVRTLKINTTDHEREKSREKSLIDDASDRGQVYLPTFKGIRSIEDPAVMSSNVPTLGTSWKVLTPPTSADVDHIRADSSAFDTPEVMNPLFGENVDV